MEEKVNLNTQTEEQEIIETYPKDIKIEIEISEQESINTTITQKMISISKVENIELTIPVKK